MGSSATAGSIQQELDAPSLEECQAQIQRIVRSAAFRNAVTSRVLLQFLANKTFAGEASSLKEYTIGVEALGRGADFDPKIETVVRVQSHRLRLRLREYYDGEGALDPVRVEILRGSYALAFADASEPDEQEAAPQQGGEPLRGLDCSEAEGAPDGLAATEQAIAEPAGRSRREASDRAFAFRPLTALLMAAGLLAGWLAGHYGSRARSDGGATAQESTDAAVSAFWHRFVGTDTTPIIAYTDAVFLLDDSNDLYRFRRGAIDSRGAVVDPHLAREFASNPGIVTQAGKLHYDNGYTGTGELQSAALLSNLLGHMGLQPVIKSSRDLSPEDLNQHNVILLGSPFQNTAVAQLLNAGAFTYENPDPHREQWRARILNTRPRAGEEASYGTERDPATEALKRDYSLFTVVPGTSPGRLVAVLGGLDTKGTEGAARFATSTVGVQQIQAALDGKDRSGNERLLPFQALIQVDLAKGYQVLETRLTAFRVLTGTEPAGDQAQAASR